MSLQSTDPIADLLTRIRNAVMVGKNEVRMPSSKLKVVIAKELKKANYLTDVKVESAKPRDILIIKINPDGENSNITEIKRLSKPGRRVYVSSTDIPRVKSGRGMILISTSKGVIPGHVAYKEKLGGELLLSIY